MNPLIQLLEDSSAIAREQFREAQSTQQAETDHQSQFVGTNEGWDQRVGANRVRLNNGKVIHADNLSNADGSGLVAGQRTQGRATIKSPL